MNVHVARRARLAAVLGARDAVLLVSPPEAVRSNDSHYRYRPSSDIFWLTGFEEPGCAVVFRPGAREPLTMFVRKKDPEREMWDGRRAGLEGAKKDFLADAAHEIGELAAKLPPLIGGVDQLHYAFGVNPEADAMVARTLQQMRLLERRLGRAPRAVADPRYSLHELRLFKTPEEIEALSRAAEVTAAGHVAAMRAARPGAGEWELEAALEGTFRRGGASAPGYPSIVGAGVNATILHYRDNRVKLADGDLVLVDAGAEVDGYTADVTRTFPASGRFSAAQRRVYELVLRAQEEAIAMTRPGRTLDAIHAHVVDVLAAGLKDLGLAGADAVKKLYPHRTSHWLGMDVHDVGAYTTVEGAPRQLDVNMVITIEPGLYFPPGDDDVPAELRGIGVRIEDDVLVTAEGARVLTASTPKAVAELEAIVGKG